MTIYAIIPVFNRLSLTKSLVTCIRRQKLNEELQLIVVNDGSTDGTSEWLAQQCDIDVINGDGTLFWGGAIDVALRHLNNKARTVDWVLLVNNDTTINEHFVQRLLDVAKKNAPAAVGSVVRHEIYRDRLLSIGVHIDPWRLITSDLLNEVDSLENLNSVVEVDALSGRGVMFPIASLTSVRGMRPGALPHYLADYEVSVRVRRAGWRLLVITNEAVYSQDEFGSTRRASSLREKFFSVRSPLFLPAHLVFWWEVSNWAQRLTLPIRLFLFFLFPRLRKS
jgi:N-acetylglucosaminyl-diphospho-decaprenol L-rhamnosyltransferase